MTKREAFEHYLRENTRTDTGTIPSYLRGMDYLADMIRQDAAGFADCEDVWQVQSVDRIQALLLKVKAEQKQKSDSNWMLEGKKSYLEGGFSVAALGHYRQFLVESQHENELLDLFHNHHGDPDELAQLLNRELELPDYLERELEGKEAIRQVKVRSNQGTFRKMILETYQNRCCITGLNFPALNIASHILDWANHEESRMDPRNGLCLSATYDKAFDQHLITLDKDYRLVVSNQIRDHYHNDHARELFEKREGQVIWMPENLGRKPLQDFLDMHRKQVVS